MSSKESTMHFCSVTAIQLRNWTLTAEHWDAPTNIHDASTLAAKHNTTHALPSLTSWTAIPGLENASGVGRYATSFHWPPPGGADGARIRFSHVLHAVAVRVNGHRLPPLDCSAPEADVGPHLVAGVNEVVVVVPATMWNYLRSIFSRLVHVGEAPLLGVLARFEGGELPPKTENGLVGTVELRPYLTHYLDYIVLPAQYRSQIHAGKPLTLDLLSTILTYHICAFPYENLDLHYASADPPNIPIDIESIFRKSTGAFGRGGYCMENSIFFNYVLRTLGFDAYLVGAKARPRVNGIPTGDFTGWMHVVNIVTLPSESGSADSTTPAKYMCDVGFGGDMPTVPVPLVTPSPVLHNSIGTQEIRLERGRIPGMRAPESSGQAFWIYQYRNAGDQPWHAAFCFTETEFLERDLEVLNWYTSRDPRCFQTFTLLVVKFLMRGGEEGGKGEVYGKLMLVNDEVKENLGGKTRLVKKCETEEERVQVLKDMFGMTLTRERREAIAGRAAEIKN
ncbi:arylamine n-acetyltransferase 2 [Neofusicoccum parvum]|uniref:Arylamine n-acetyltransferase 2 n=1 Tax=Neofusicoccum parvum TaxID=310453 RepID=A0ACB5SNY8_9PEZI|nr:arylamine n-acetyltransferase 2 [Neofusicoccum parvum]